MDAIMNEKTGIIEPVGVESTKSDAISVYKANLERDPGNARIYIEMARCHIRAKNYRKAVECIEIYLHLSKRFQCALPSRRGPFHDGLLCKVHRPLDESPWV